MDLLLRRASLIDGTGGAGPARRRRRRRRSHHRGRARPASSTPDAGHRGRRPRRPGAGARLHRHPHPLRRADPLGRRPHAVELARRDQRGHGQLRLRRGAHAARAPRHDRAHARERRGHVDRGARRRASTGASRPSPSTSPRSTQRPKRLNVGAFIGHTPLRLFVLGGDERAATDDEVDTMCGARARGDGGRAPSASRPRASRPTRARTAARCRAASPRSTRSTPSPSVLGELGKGVVQVSIGPGLFVDQFSELAVRNGVPVTWTALVDPRRQAGRRAAHGRAGRRAARRGLPADRLPPDRHADQHGRPDAAGRDRRVEGGAGPSPRRAGRPLPRPGVAGPGPADDPRRLEPPLVEDRASRRPTPTTTLVGVPLDQLAERAGHHAVRPHARPRAEPTTWPRASGSCWTTTATTRSASCWPTSARCSGLSDAGAHASQLCDACYSTHLLGHWVRERKALSLEDAVWRLTGHPHQAFRIAERGPRAGGLLRRPRRLRPRDRRDCTPVERVARPARRRRPAGRAQHRRRAHLGQRRGHPRRRRRGRRRRARAASCAADRAALTPPS